MRKIVFMISLSLVLSFQSYGQQEGDINQLRQEILAVQADVDHIILNLETSKKKFQTGIFIATLGYSITIAGGLMLGRENDELGQALLITGGATGGLGTYMLVDAFKYLGRVRRNR